MGGRLGALMRQPPAPQRAGGFMSPQITTMPVPSGQSPSPGFAAGLRTNTTVPVRPPMLNTMPVQPQAPVFNGQPSMGIMQAQPPQALQQLQAGFSPQGNPGGAMAAPAAPAAPAALNPALQRRGGLAQLLRGQVQQLGSQ